MSRIAILCNLRRRPLRLSYSSVVRRIRYGENQANVNLGFSDLGTTDPMDFTPHGFNLFGSGTAREVPYYHGMHQFQVNHYGDFVKSLSLDEKEALDPNKPEPIKIARMNSYLTGYKKAPPAMVPHIERGIKTMDQIIQKSPPLTHDLIVYRGLGSIHPDDAPQKGSILYSPGFQSTSLNGFISRHGFSDHDAVARIHIPAGTRLGPITAHQISDYGVRPDENRFMTMEQELLLGRGHHLLVTHPIKWNPMTLTHYLNMKLLPQGPAPVSEPGAPVVQKGSWMVKRSPGARTRSLS